MEATHAVFDLYKMDVKREKEVDGVTKVHKLCTKYCIFNTFPLMSPLSYANT